MTQNDPEIFDIFVVGGGVNGAGIARDATGRGYSVALAEMNDFASGTSSASTKLFHGGLRYLEYFEVRLVQEALKEREILLKAMPHISWPMRFVLPIHSEMRFDSETPASKLLATFMPWMKGRRPKWLIRFGLFLYDNLGGREILPGTTSLDLTATAEGKVLEPRFEKAFEYSDCWVEDSRLTLLNVQDAQQRGAKILARTMVKSAVQSDGKWKITTVDQTGNETLYWAKLLVNAGGPWVKKVVSDVVDVRTSDSVRLVRGSHIVVKKLYDHDKCYFFQGSDGRIMFAIPYEEDFTLIGTTDVEHASIDEPPVCSEDEIAYMVDFVNEYFQKDVTRDDVVWTYSGIRPLYEDGAGSASAASRDYVLRMDASGDAQVLNVYGGKITTYRRLAESALDLIDKASGRATQKWTSAASLPGGDVAVDVIPQLRAELADALPFVDAFTIRRLIRQYGTQALSIFQGTKGENDLGQHFGAGIYALEIDWAIRNEWVTTAQDFLWRRSKMGLRLTPEQASALDDYIKQKVPA